MECKQKLFMELVLGFVDSSGRAKGAGCRQCLGDTRSSCRAIAAALISRVSNHVLLHSILRSISLHQPGTSELDSDLFLVGAGQFIGGQCSFSGENCYNVKSQVLEGK